MTTFAPDTVSQITAKPRESGPERVPDERGHGVDRVDAVLLRSVPVGQHGDQIVTPGAIDPAGGVDLPPIDDGEPILERHVDPRSDTTRRAPVLGGGDVLHEVED